MKVCICSINSQYIHSSLAPWCLLSGVRTYAEADVTAQVVEGTINEPPDQTVARVAAVQPELIGFCCYIWNITRVLELLPLVKQLFPHAVIVLGGPEVGYRPEDTLRSAPLADYVLTGEGEYSFAKLCDCVATGQLPHLPGITYRRGAETVSVAEQPLAEEPPSPYCDEYFQALQGRIAYLETSRGCPYSCAYCLSARCGKLRFYDIDRAKRELLLLANSGTQTVKLVDRTFNAHRARAKELFSFIIAHYGTEIPRGVSFHFEIAGDLLDDETIDLLLTAPVGAIQLEIGIQSFHEQTLTYIRRKTNLSRLTENIRRLVAGGNMHVHIDLIAGLPLEDFATFGHSLNQAYALGAHMLQLGFLKVIHGSPLREDSSRYPCEFDPQPPYQVRHTPCMTPQDLARLHRVEWALDRLYNSGRFSRSLSYVLKQSGQTPFSFFLGFGEWSTLSSGASLSAVAEAFYQYAISLGISAQRLRDHLVCDWLATVRGGKLPPFLQKTDGQLMVFRKALRNNPCTAPVPRVPRGTALLYHPLRGVYVDYVHPHPITGEYLLQEVLLTDHQ